MTISVLNTHYILK